MQSQAIRVIQHRKIVQCNVLHYLSTSWINPKRSLSTKKTAEIRSEFLSFFEKKNFKISPSSTLVPASDPSILFTSAGMVPLKNYFQGIEKVPNGMEKLTSVQKCLRANDLDNVGRTARHHTFFEMLGFFSFGQTSKEEAISLAWEFLTSHLKLPKEKLRVTVYQDDDEAADIWRKNHNIPPEKILRRGKEDNFWSIGEGVGPCGPCSEIYYDQGVADSDGERWLEIWNVVFMQYRTDESGKLHKLQRPCIDTGMGLERLMSVLQGKTNNFDIDVFSLLLQSIRSLAVQRGHSKDFSGDDVVATKIIAGTKCNLTNNSDHLRATCFLLCDGVVPSNLGRGYVLRRIIRRAAKCGHQLGIQGPFLSDLVFPLIQVMGEAYPELREKEQLIKEYINQEEVSFSKTMVKGMKILQTAIKNIQSANDNSDKLPSDIAFKLFDSYGFPVDLTATIAKEHNMLLNLSEFESLLLEQKERGRASWKDNPANLIPEDVKNWGMTKNIFSTFTGYQVENQESVIKAISRSKESGYVWLSIDPCPFYAAGGGQIGDTGTLELKDGTQLAVVDAIRPYKGGIALKIRCDDEKFEDLVHNGIIKENNKVNASVNKRHRKGVRRHHSATHLLQAALRSVLGSLVAPGRLHFDFTYGNKLTSQQIVDIEEWVNKAIEEDVDLSVNEMAFQDAIGKGVLYLPNEKYENQVRVIEIPGFSKELCGGTHVYRTSEIQAFKITEERSVAAGIRRIEALAGNEALGWLRYQHNILQGVVGALQVPYSNAVESVKKLLNDNLQLEKNVRNLQLSQLIESSQKHTKSGKLEESPVLIHHLDDSVDSELLKEYGKKIVAQNPSFIHLIVSGKRITCLVDEKSNAKANAGKILQKILSATGGKGGGSPSFASGQFSENSSLEKLKSLIKP